MTTSALENDLDETAQGAAGAPEADETTNHPSEDAATADAGAQDASDGSESLGDAGKKALDRMKADRKAALDRARAAEAELAALKAAAEGREAEHKAEQDRRATEEAALAKANQRILNSEVRAAAAGKLADPSDALKYLDLSEFEVGEDGETDTEAISGAIDDLLTRKPYLAAQGGRRFEGKGDGGARGATKPSQLTRADVEKLAREGKHAEINKARAEGRLDKALGIT